MTTCDIIKREYFNWMYYLMCDNRYFRRKREGSYKKLFKKLHNNYFVTIIPMDDNRAADGIDLRYRFGHEMKYSDREIAAYLDNQPCTVLEMIVALAIRCEEHIMEDSEYGDRTAQWFWNMIVSLGLGGMDDSHYTIQKAEYVEDCIERFLYRKYERNGEGGLFTVKHPKRDMRNVEIWYQMCMYLEEEYDA